MKLAECLLQERPIRRKLFMKWCKPEIVKSNISPFAALPTVCGTDKYTLDYTNITAEDWEVKQEPLKVEFECEFLNKDGLISPYTNVEGVELLTKLHKSGKRFRVTCEEIVE